VRVNIYAEELTDRVEIISKEIEGNTYTAVRFYLELPATVDGKQYRAPFMHRPGDDDSSAVTFWGKKKLRELLVKALAELDKHHEAKSGEKIVTPTLAACLLRRIKRDSRLAYHFDPITESMQMLTSAYAAEQGIDVEEFRKSYYPLLRFERPSCPECGAQA